MNKPDCETVLKSDIQAVLPVLNKTLSRMWTEYLPACTPALKPVSNPASNPSCRHPESVEFISNTSFTEGVLKFTEKAGRGAFITAA